MTFITLFETKVKKTIKDYNLISKKDKIIVACSGGKDSTTVLYLLHKFGYKVEALTIDLLIGDWSKKNVENLKMFCKEHKIKLHIINLRQEIGSSICYVRSNIQEKSNLGNCTICGIIKRWLINKKARVFKADKIAIGHNLDDEAETILMNLLKGNPQLSICMGPKTYSTEHLKFVKRVKPLYFSSNADVKKYSKLKKFPVLYEPCPCSSGVFRREIRNNLLNIEKVNKQAKLNIVKKFLKDLPQLKKNASKNKLIYCEICGEPSRNKVCRYCQMLKLMRS